MKSSRTTTPSFNSRTSRFVPPCIAIHTVLYGARADVCQTWHFHLIPKTATINALVSLVLDPATKDSDFPLILYHKDQANEKDYSHEGFGFTFKKTQADLVSKFMSSKEVQYFKGDAGAEKEPVRKYGSGTAEAPLATHV